MKLIFINRYYYPDHSPTSVLLADVSGHLAAAGHDVHVITSRQRYDDPRARLPSGETKDGVKIHRVWTSRFGRQSLPGRFLDYLTFYPSAAVKLAGLAAKGDLVVAKTDPPLISVPAWIVARLKGSVLVNWLQDLYPEIAEALGVNGARGFMGGVWKAVRNASLRGARVNVAVDEEMGKRLAWQGIPDSKIAVIHNWADGEAIRPQPPGDNGLRKEWGLADKFVVGYTGNLGRVYDFDVVVEAAEKLRDRPDIVFLFVGNGPQKARIQEACRRRGLEQVLFKPPAPASRAGDVMSLPDVHLISVRPGTEGCVMPSKLYAAMAAGRPIIYAGDSGSAAKIIEAELCGFAVPRGDAEALVDRIAKICEFGELRAQMGERSRAAFEKNYDKKNALGRWHKLLAALSEGTS